VPTTPISRRNFTLCLGATAFRLPAATDPGPWDGPATIHKVYLATPKPTWPYRSLDFKQEVAGADAILVLDLTTSTSSQFEALDKLDTPLLLFQRPLTSWAFMNFAGYIQRGKRADMINSSEFADLIPHMHMLRAMHHVANSKLLVLRPGHLVRRLIRVGRTSSARRLNCRPIRNSRTPTIRWVPSKPAKPPATLPDRR
jgi:hypothetical protein